MPDNTPLSLSQLAASLRNAICAVTPRGVWVVAELYDVAVRGGHCYMELIEKDSNSNITARLRAVIWANVFRTISAEFTRATGAAFATGLKVMVFANASYHPVYGLSLVITAVNPAYTLGEKERRRRERIERLQREGILQLNRRLKWPEVPQRIAVISAPGAAGYGDFINQLYHNPSRLRFDATLFQAVMQGVNAPASIIAALDDIASRADDYDGVVIIRGGGASSDLECFEDYDLAAHIAQFPLPVIIGLGHERDITLLDYVANMRVKTPTAAAEWFISLGENALGRLDRTSVAIADYVRRRIAGENERLAYTRSTLAAISATRIAPAATYLDSAAQRLADTIRNTLTRRLDALDSHNRLISALSPQATLRRGFTITRVDGRILRTPADVRPGATLTTQTATATIRSIISPD